MIRVLEKSQCCGCTACMAICPKQCIVMKEDVEGFSYPVANKNFCTDCGLCEKICPIKNTTEERMPLAVYAAKNNNEQIRFESSSGGIFTLLAVSVIEQGGVVFGACFNRKWEVVHNYTETKEGLAAFRGSKYVQSYMGDCYKRVKHFLDIGRRVMFTGTPCQIAGLRNFLHKDYENLLTVDLVCHGVPSPLVWKKYLEETVLSHSYSFSPEEHNSSGKEIKIKAISFRSKNSGWKKYSFALRFSVTDGYTMKNVVLFSKLTENPFMHAFLSDCSLRPCCYTCPVKGGKSRSDLKLGDFWGIEEYLPKMDDDKGISLVMPYTEKGVKVCELFEREALTYEHALQGNVSIEKSVYYPLNRNYFFHCFQKDGFHKAWRKTNSMQFYQRVRRLLYRKYGI